MASKFLISIKADGETLEEVRNLECVFRPTLVGREMRSHWVERASDGSITVYRLLQTAGTDSLVGYQSSPLGITRVSEMTGDEISIVAA